MDLISDWEFLPDHLHVNVRMFVYLAVLVHVLVIAYFLTICAKEQWSGKYRRFNMELLR